MVFPRFSHGFPMVFLCFSVGLPPSHHAFPRCQPRHLGDVQQQIEQRINVLAPWFFGAFPIASGFHGIYGGLFYGSNGDRRITPTTMGIIEI